MVATVVPGNNPRDVDWVMNSFILAGGAMESAKQLRYFRNLSTADFKYQGSGYGEDDVINPRPQFTPLADIRAQGLWESSNGGVKSSDSILNLFTGMGRSYSDMFHENRQTVHIRYGVTQYKGLLTFFTGFYDHNSAILARQGRASLAYYLGSLAGAVPTLFLQPFILTGQAFKYIMGRTSSSYMSLKPTMPLFWLRANVIMNSLGANLGIIPRAIENTGLYGSEDEISEMQQISASSDYTGRLKKLLPGVVDSNGQIDLQKGIQNGARRRLEWSDRVSNLAIGSGKGGYQAVIDALSKPVTGKGYQSEPMQDYLRKYHESVMGNVKDENEEAGDAGGAPITEMLTTLSEVGAAASEKTPAMMTARMASATYQKVGGWLSSAKGSFVDEWNRSTAFINYEVDYTGSGTMSINNSSKEATISSTVRGISSTARDTRVSMSDYNTGIGFVDKAKEMLTDFVGGALDSVQMSGLLALGGSAFTVFPKHWDDTTVTVPTANFTIELRGFSGNALSQYLHQFPTIATLLAGAVPISTGPQSYTAPFMCEAYCRGAFAIRYGMISSITITHGDANLGYDEHRRPLSFKVDVEIADLTNMYHASISDGGSPLGNLKRVFDDDNAFNDYLSTITGLSINDMVDPRRKLSIRLAQSTANLKSWWAPSHIGSRIAGSTPINVVNKLFGPSTFAGL